MAGWRDLLGTTISSFKIGINKATLAASGLTAARTYTLPDVSGTVALTSDVAGAGDFKKDGTVPMSGTLTSTLGTITAQKPHISASVTLNNAAVSFILTKQNVTNTASDFSSRFAAWQVSGVDKAGLDLYGAFFGTSFNLQNAYGTGADTGISNPIGNERNLGVKIQGNYRLLVNDNDPSNKVVALGPGTAFAFTNTDITYDYDAYLKRSAYQQIDLLADMSGGFADMRMRSLFFMGSTSGNVKVSASAVAGTPTITLPAASGTLALTSQLGISIGMTNVEVSLGTTPRRSGSFTIAGTGLATGNAVLITKAVGPYTGKGALADEAEMDVITVSASVLNSTTIKAFWASATRVRGNHKFIYQVSA